MIKKAVPLILTVAIVLTSFVIPANATTNTNAKEIKVLIVGTQHVSFVGSSIGDGLTKIAALKGKKITTTSLIDGTRGMNGLNVLWNKYGAKTKATLANTYYDYIILENFLYDNVYGEYTQEHKDQELADYKAGAKKWVDFARANDIQPILYISPQFLPKASVYEYPSYMQMNLSVVDELKLPVINAAKAALDYRLDPTFIRDDSDPGKPTSIIMQDRWHPNQIGTLFAGMQLYYALYNEKVDNIPFEKIDPTKNTSKSTDPIYLGMTTDKKKEVFQKMYEFSWNAFQNDYATEFSVTKYDAANTVNPAKNFTLKIGGKTIKNLKWTYNDEYELYSLNILPVMKKLGYKVKVKKDKKKKPKEYIFTKKKQKTITIPVGKKKYTIGKKKYSLKLSAKFKDKALYVPIKAFGKSIGYKKYKLLEVKNRVMQLKK